MALLLSLLLLVSIPMLLAYFIRQTESKTNQFEQVQVSCEAEEVVSGNVKSSIIVKNTSSIPVYIRVRLVSYWKTPSGDIAGRNSTAPSFTLADGWLYDQANDTYYYTKPVKVGDSTPNLLDSNITLVEDNGYIQVVEILAEAIQAAPNAAVETAWPFVKVAASGDLGEKTTT